LKVRLKVGDLVMPVHNPRRDDGYIGVIVALDEDSDPVVLWNKYDSAETHPYLRAQYRVPEYRSSVELINESR